MRLQASACITSLFIAGKNGKTTVTQTIGHVLEVSGSLAGLTTKDGILDRAEDIALFDMAGPWSAGVVLSDPRVEVGVLETARGGIVRSRLGYDWSDLSVMTNIHPDHIDQDGMESVEGNGDLQMPALERCGLGFNVIEAENCLVVPRFIDSHKHLLGGSDEEVWGSQTPEIALSEIVAGGIKRVGESLAGVTRNGDHGSEQVASRPGVLLKQQMRLNYSGVSAQWRIALAESSREPVRSRGLFSIIRNRNFGQSSARSCE